MRLVASLIVRNERGRFLDLCIDHLLAFCDEIRVLDDHSDDGTFDWLMARDDRVQPLRVGYGPTFFAHEGRARQRLLEWTLEAEPTHVLAIDADELVTDGGAVRAACEADAGPGVWLLQMQEVWKADRTHLWLRSDGAWGPHPASVLWRVPSKLDRTWRIRDEQLACGREPMAVRKLASRGAKHIVGAEILHLGWANEAARAARYERYRVADGGRFHAIAHLRSIMFEDRKVRLKQRPWPQQLLGMQERLLEIVNAKEEPMADHERLIQGETERGQELREARVHPETGEPLPEHQTSTVTREDWEKAQEPDG